MEKEINFSLEGVTEGGAKGDAGKSNLNKDEAYYIRHSMSGYKTYIKQKEAGNPGFNPNDQEFPDLSEGGIELAREKAREFFDGLDPEKDILFFASSNEARALATANIYREEAKRRGFEIIKPTKTNLELSDKETDGFVRMSSMLSLNPRNYLEHSIFVTGLPDFVENLIAKNLPEDLREKWLKAREITKGLPEEVKKKGFGEVYHRCADRVKELFPDVRNAEQMEKRFQNIVKLAKWGIEKAKKADLKKNFKILGFGHENYASPVLEKYFGDREMENCEAIRISPIVEGGAELERRGEKVQI